MHKDGFLGATLTCEENSFLILNSVWSRTINSIANVYVESLIVLNESDESMRRQQEWERIYIHTRNQFQANGMQTFASRRRQWIEALNAVYFH